MIAKLSRKDIKMLESSVKNDVSKSALEEYLSAHKKAETAWKVFRDSLVLSEGNSEDNASKEVKSEKIRKFKAGDKVRVLSGKSNIATTKLRVEDITEVICYKEDDSKYATLDPNFRSVVVLDPADASGQGFFEEYALELVEEKSPNELRAEIIEKAKEFVDECRNEKMVVRVDSRHYSVDVSFIVNADKRIVVALLRGVSTDLVRVKNDAKFHSDDVLNEHIGKAIALGRALGKDVSELKNAVQPDFEVGQIVRFTPKYEGREVEIQITKTDGEKLWFVNEYGVEMYLDTGVNDVKIINDTHAQYKVLNNE